MMDPVVTEFQKNTPAWLLDKHRHHVRQVGDVIQKCVGKALLAGVALARDQRRSWSEPSIFMSGSLAEGASLARMFSPDRYTSREFELDIMLTFFELEADESVVRYVEKSPVFAHVQVDSSVFAQMESFSDENTESALTRCEDGVIYLNSIHIKDWFKGKDTFSKNLLYRFSTDSAAACLNASIALIVDDVTQTDDCLRTNSTTSLFQSARQMKPICDRFESTFAEMMTRVLTLQEELEIRSQGDLVSLQSRAAKALEWAKTCVDVTDLIFDCRQETLCALVNKGVGFDLGSRSEEPRDYLRQKLGDYIDRLSVTEDQLSDRSVAEAVTRTVDYICSEASQDILRTFEQLSGDIATFSRMISFAELNPQLCQVPPSLEKQSAIIKRYSIDYVPCIRLMFWPRVAAEWTSRDRLWPDRSVVKRIVSKGAHMVGKAFCHEDIDWRLSFSVAEIDLATGWTPEQHFVYFMFKSLFYKFIKPLSADDRPRRAAAEAALAPSSDGGNEHCVTVKNLKILYRVKAISFV